MAVELPKDGVVLPHGGINLKQFSNPLLEWRAGSNRLDEDQGFDLQSDFAVRGDSLGYFATNVLVTPLVFVGGSDGRPEWRLCLDGVRPIGLAPYFFTHDTAEALQDAEQVTHDVIRIENVCYRLHAAFNEGMHLALLIEVDR